MHFSPRYRYRYFNEQITPLVSIAVDLLVAGRGDHPVGHLVLEGEGKGDPAVGEDAAPLRHGPDPLHQYVIKRQ